MAALLAVPLAAQAADFTFQDGDMVVLVGNTFVERAQSSGYLELELQLAAGAKGLRFRNLAWSGDTVFGDARSYFGPPQEGFERLTAQMEALKPDVVLLCYGAVAAFEGEAGLAKFTEGYRRLIGMIREKAAPREVVLISPPPAESLGAPLPDMTTHNERLATYRDAIRVLAVEGNLRFADLFKAVGDLKKDGFLTGNGLHYTPEGYAAVSPPLVGELGLKPVDRALLRTPEAVKLRELIVEKDRLYFHRWRPANETYLHLFRKHEQGQNAKELPMFEPLVEAREKEIEMLKTQLLSR